MKCLVFDVELQDFYEAELPKDYTGYYDLLKCDTFDIQTVRVGGALFDVFVDDEGLLKDNCVPSAVVVRKKENGEIEPVEVMLVGNLVFTHHELGETVGISDEDIQLIRKNIFKIPYLTSGGMFKHNVGKILKMVEVTYG